MTWWANWHWYYLTSFWRSRWMTFEKPGHLCVCVCVCSEISLHWRCKNIWRSIKPHFFSDPKVDFFSPDAFQFHPEIFRGFVHVMSDSSHQSPKNCGWNPRSSRVPVPPAAPHGDPSNPSRPIMGFRVPQKNGCMVFFFLFFFWGVWIFLGAKTQQYGFFPNNQPKLEQFSGVLQFSRFQPGFLFLFYHLKAGSGCSSRIPPSKAPNSLCTKLLHLIPDSVGGWIGL